MCNCIIFLQSSGFHLFHGWVIFCYTYVYAHTCKHTYHIFFIRSPVDEHLGWFDSFTLMNWAATNTEVQVTLWCDDFISFGDIPRNGVAELYHRSIFSFLRNNGCASLDSHQQCYQGTFFFIALPAFAIFVLFLFLDDSCSIWNELISYCDFYLHFPDG